MTRSAVLSRRELLAAAATALPLPLALAGCGSEPDALARMRRAGFVRLGIADEPPFGYSVPGGKVTGFAVEAARAAFAGLGVPRAVGVVTEFELLLDGVLAGAFDVIAAGMYVLPERCRRVSFSTPIYGAAEALAVRAGNPLGLGDYGDVAQHPRARLGVLAGAVEATDAPRAGVPADRVLTFPSRQALGDGLERGVVDAVALSTISIRRLIQSAERPERLAMGRAFTPVVEGRPRPSIGALALRPDDDVIRRGLDEQIAGMHRSGALARLGRRFGVTRAEIDDARAARIADLCRGRG